MRYRIGWWFLCVLASSAGLRGDEAPTGEIDRTKLEQLDRRAAAMLRAGKLDEAETLLTQALNIAPRYHRSLYNMACVKARRGRLDAAMDYLERAADEGFTDFIHIQTDADLRPLRELDRYKQLIARKDELQKRDAQRTRLILEKQFAEGYLHEVDDEHKLILAMATDRPTLEATKRLLAMRIESQCQEVFANRPDQYIIVILPTPARYAEMARPGVGGGYDHSTHILIVQRLGQLLTHEFTHALHNADLDGTGQEHAVWVAEGLATMYEGGRFDGQKLISGDNYRLSDVQRAAAEGGLIPLSRLVQMDQAAFNRVANKAYGQAGSIMLLLHERDLLRKFYESYKATHSKDKTGRLALERTTGLKLAEFERLWVAWMMQRRPPTNADGGASLGVRFGVGHDGLPIMSVQAGSAAARAGVRPGDVIVGMDDADVRDAYTLIPMLRARRPGDVVFLKMRRRGQYVEIAVRP